METLESRSDILPPELTVALLEALLPKVPDDPTELKNRILGRIARMSGAPSTFAITTVRAAEGEWTPFAPGVESKLLHDDGLARTWLARMEREANLPGHVHESDEECLLLEGSLYLGEILMAPGDYQVARSGSRHDRVYSPTGCVLLVRSASPKVNAPA